MKSKFNGIFLITLFAFLITTIQFNLKLRTVADEQNLTNRSISRDRELYKMAVKNEPNVSLIISFTVCGEGRIEEAHTMMKSAIIFSKSPLTFYIFTEPKYFDKFRSMMLDINPMMKERVRIVLNDAKYPEHVNEMNWKTLYHPCSSLRIFLPDLLVTTTDAVLYLDTDVVFLSPVEMVWQHFKRMNSSQLVGVVTDHYNTNRKHPFYGKSGINTGVMLMNLTRMRESNWRTNLVKLMHEYSNQLTHGDQDIINILLYFNPEQAFILDCSYNYKAQNCYFKTKCVEMETTGVKVMHALLRTAYNDDFAPMRDTYRVMQQVDLLNENAKKDLYLALRNTLSLSLLTNLKCGAVSSYFHLNLEILNDWT